jgi:hypothetical protein
MGVGRVTGIWVMVFGSWYLGLDRLEGVAQSMARDLWLEVLQQLSKLKPTKK